MTEVATTNEPSYDEAVKEFLTYIRDSRCPETHPCSELPSGRFHHRLTTTRSRPAGPR